MDGPNPNKRARSNMGLFPLSMSRCIGALLPKRLTEPALRDTQLPQALPSGTPAASRLPERSLVLLFRSIPLCDPDILASVQLLFSGASHKEAA